MTAKSMKVERYARINIPIMKDVYEVLEPAIVAVVTGIQGDSRYRIEEVRTSVAILFVRTLGLHLVWPGDAFIILLPTLRIFLGVRA
jgi:hypothetical protein